jgi:hypothetical protein
MLLEGHNRPAHCNTDILVTGTLAWRSGKSHPLESEAQPTTTTTTTIIIIIIIIMARIKVRMRALNNNVSFLRMLEVACK